MYKIIGKRGLNAALTATEMIIEAPLVAGKCEPGQFIMLRIDEFGERIPLTIAGYDREKGTVTIMFQPVGKTTGMLNLLEPGDVLADFVGPLGKPSETDGLKRVAVVGGGVGCAIAYPIAKKLFMQGAGADIIVGFKNKDAVILENEMRGSGTNLFIMTDDGSYGEKGFTTEKLKSLLAGGRAYDAVFAIGPAVMMKIICELTKPFGIKTAVSLNPIMIDGTGMCGCCRVTVGGSVKFACVDGPEFDGHKVDWRELIARTAFYRDEETAAKEHICRVTGEVRTYA
jgi:ferredoxin--NADP+ reductase